MIKNKANILNLFPTTIYYSRHLEIDNKSLEKHILKISKNNISSENTNIGGAQYYFNNNDTNLSFQNLKKVILREVNNYAEEINLKTPLKLQNIWANINGYKDFNNPHIHSQSLVSGVYYVKVPKNGGDLKFLHPKYELLGYDWQPRNIKKFEIANSSEWFFYPKNNIMFLFPNWATHEVTPNLNKKEKRISISFNFWSAND